MNINILSFKYVIENGTEYSQLEPEIFTDRLLISDTDVGFTGLVYEAINENEIYWYCMYVNGFMDGDWVQFYTEDSIWKITSMKYGVGDGEYREWDKEGNLIEEGTLRLGIYLTYKKYDDKGNIIREKVGPNKHDVNIINKRLETHRN